MVNLSELESQAMSLSQSDRAKLASHLLDSLQPVLDDEDDGIAEALRRDAEMDADPSASLSMEEFVRAIGR